jgi:multidrug efflux pump subunit AcrB
MWIVRLALSRPYTFIVLALAILILGPLAILRTPTDVLPNINLPVVSVIWNYTGLSAEEMSSRIVTVTERALTTTVDDIQHIESQSLRGVAVVKIIGMLPMALGLGEGGEQNAPLGRAVIGGLVLATVSTLLFVPVFFSLLHAKQGPGGPAPSA